VQDLQSTVADAHDVHRCWFILQAIDFADLLRAQYLLKSPTGKSTGYCMMLKNMVSKRYHPKMVVTNQDAPQPF